MGARGWGAKRGDPRVEGKQPAEPAPGVAGAARREGGCLPRGGGVPARLSAGPRPLGCSSRARRGGEGRAPRAALPPGGGGDGGPGLQQPFPGVSSPTPRPPRLQPAEGVRHPWAGAAIPSRCFVPSEQKLPGVTGGGAVSCVVGVFFPLSVGFK